MTTEKNNPGDAYLTTKVMTASQEELRLLLIDGAIKFATKGRMALESRDFEGCHEGYTRARAIILELVNSMRREVAPDLCDKLSAIYMFCYRLLTESSAEKDPKKADQAIELLNYDRETWVMLLEQVNKERGAAQQVRDRVAQRGPGGQPAGQPSGHFAGISVSG